MCETAERERGLELMDRVQPQAVRLDSDWTLRSWEWFEWDLGG